MARIIGLTGGIASGKSTVTSYLREKGYPVIDADRVVHDLQAPGGALYRVLVDHFGKEILTQEGELDRVALGQRIFSAMSPPIKGPIKVPATTPVDKVPRA
jgi:dephospho-CoA kinase